MATEKTYICLACHQTMEALPEFSTYPEAWRHCKDQHNGQVFLDTRIRVKKD